MLIFFLSVAEIPAGTKRVCITCFGRINKRICQLEEGGGGGENAAGSSSASSSATTAASASSGKKEEQQQQLAAAWSDNEIEMVKQSLRYDKKRQLNLFFDL
jgi:hypothetical protein